MELELQLSTNEMNDFVLAYMSTASASVPWNPSCHVHKPISISEIG